MTTIPAGANFSPTEKAYFESGGAVHPETGKLTTEENTAAPEIEQEKPVEADVEETEIAPEKTVAKTDEAEADADEEVVEVQDSTNPDAAARRKMIAFGAYEKQRKQAKAAREQLENMGKQLAFLTGRLQGLTPTEQKAETQPQISASPPDYKTKPEEWLDWVNQTVSHAASFTQQQGQATVQQQQFHQLNEAVLQNEESFIAGDPDNGVEAHPDFYDALKFVQDRHKAELREAGYNPAEIQQIMTARAQDLAIRALNTGKNPAERIYAVAKQHGYRKAATKAAMVETEAAKVVRQAEGQSKAKSIATLAGGAEKGLSIEALANTPMEQFQKLWKQGKPHDLMGIPKS